MGCACQLVIREENDDDDDHDTRGVLIFTVLSCAVNNNSGWWYSECSTSVVNKAGLGRWDTVGVSENVVASRMLVTLD